MKSCIKYLTGIKPVSCLKVALYGLLLFMLYRSALDYLFRKWQSEDFTYCYIIPFIVLFLIWEKREKLAAIPSAPSWKGFIPLTIGLVLFLLGELGGEFTMLFLSLWLVIIALCSFHIGWAKMKVISFPLVFSLASFVPPNALYLPLTFRLKLISSQIGVYMMQLYGLSAYREGNVIDLGFTKLQVVDACSGLRYVIPLFLMGLLLAYYYKGAFWKKTLLVLSTIPVSIITNSLRIASVGILYQFWGPMVAEGFFHDFSGWFIFMAGMSILLAEMWVMKKVFKERGARNEERGIGGEKLGAGSQKSAERSQESDTDLEPRTSNLEPQEASQSLARFFHPAQFLAAIVVLLVTIGLTHAVNFKEKTPLSKPFASFPLQVGEWNGAQTAMEKQFLDALKLSDYAIIDYRNGKGKDVNFYVAYNQSQSKGEATHSPGTCLPGSGWNFEESGTCAVLLSDKPGAEITVSRAFMEKNGVRQVTYYWFPQRGRVLTNLYQIKLYNFWDALVRQRTDGALVRIITQVYENESLGEAEQRLQGFTRQIVPVLGTYLPR